MITLSQEWFEGKKNKCLSIDCFLLGEAKLNSYFVQLGVVCWEIQDGSFIHPSVISAVMAEVAVGWLSVSSYKFSSCSLLGFPYQVMVLGNLVFV